MNIKEKLLYAIYQLHKTNVNDISIFFDTSQMTKRHHFLVAVRYLYIEGYVENDEKKMNIYKKINLHRDCMNAEKRASSFEKLINNMKHKGFDHNYPILVDLNNNIFNGTHRVATACYFDIKEIPTKKVFRRLRMIPLEELIDDFGLSAEEFNIINNTYKHIYISLHEGRNS